MTPKEKARELFNMFIPHSRYVTELHGTGIIHSSCTAAKQCALIAVQMYIDDIACYEESCNRTADVYNGPDSRFWDGVKQEIEKL